MLAFWVVEELDVIEYVLASLFAVWIGFSSDPFSLQQLEKALGNRVVIAVPTSAHAGLQIVGQQEPLPLMAGKLAALI